MSASLDGNELLKKADLLRSGRCIKLAIAGAVLSQIVAIIGFTWLLSKCTSP